MYAGCYIFLWHDKVTIFAEIDSSKTPSGNVKNCKICTIMRLLPKQHPGFLRENLRKLMFLIQRNLLNHLTTETTAGRSVVIEMAC